MQSTFLGGGQVVLVPSTVVLAHLIMAQLARPSSRATDIADSR